MIVDVESEAEWEAAVAAGHEPRVSTGEWTADQLGLVMHVTGDARLQAYEGVTVHGSGAAVIEALGATVHAYDDAAVYANSASVSVGGSATVYATVGMNRVRASGSATVFAVSQADVLAFGRATVYAYDRATVRAHDSVLVIAPPHVPVIAFSEEVTVQGGTPIVWPRGLSIEDWAAWHGLEVHDGTVTLFASVDDGLASTLGHVYEPGTSLAVDPGTSRWSWLVFGPVPMLADHGPSCSRPVRWMSCSVRVEDIDSPYGPGGRVLASACRVLTEVDVLGRPI